MAQFGMEDGILLFEDRPTGLFYLGPLEKGQEIISDRDWRVTYDSRTGRFTVEIAYLSGFGEGPGQGVAEDGWALSLEEAWRFALGAALG